MRRGALTGWNPRAIGTQSEGAVFADLLRRGFVVAMPFGCSPRYDLLVEVGDQFVKIQVKTGQLIDGAVEFPTSSTEQYRGRGRKPYQGQCDYFAVFCPQTGQVYYVPVDICGRRGCSLRIDPTRNGQSVGVRWARDYVDFAVP